ncbi:MAG: RimK family alpha-L-glutamate ligase [Candidatus Nanohaloarchaea archaeon]
MKALKITENEHEEFDPLFEDVEHVGVDQLAPWVSRERADVTFNGRSVSEYDAAFAEIPAKNAVFGRVLLEMMEEKGIRLNYPSTGFFIMAKKNYLYHTLHEKGVSAPKTVVIAEEKAMRNLGDHLEAPVVGKRFHELKEVEKSELEDMDDVEEFTEGVEYGENFLIFHSLNRGDKYRCLVTGDNVISLADTTETWEMSTDNLKYTNMSRDLRELAKTTARKIGTECAEVLIRDGQVVDVNPNPDLQTYTEVSGKNAYESLAEVLRGEDQ